MSLTSLPSIPSDSGQKLLPKELIKSSIEVHAEDKIHHIKDFSLLFCSIKTSSIADQVQEFYQLYTESYLVH